MDIIADWVKRPGRSLRSAGRWAAVPLQVVKRDRRPGVVVLLYHRVGGGTSSDVDMAARMFERQMQYVRRHCLVVSLDDVTKFSNGRAVRQANRSVVAITFDDAYRDTYDFAYPILRGFGLPATIYVPSMYVEAQRAFDFGRFATLASNRRPRPITWDQAREMVRSGLITIGSHTHTHLDLSLATAEEAGREVEECDRLIERRLGVVPRHFAYPWGRIPPATEAIIASRYSTVALGGPGKNPYLDLDLSRLWRYPVLRTDGYWLFRIRMHLLASPNTMAGGSGQAMGEGSVP